MASIRSIFSPLIVALFALASLSVTLVVHVHAQDAVPGYVACDLDDIDCGVPLDPSDSLFLATRPDAIELARRADMRDLASLEPVAQRRTYRRSSTALASANRCGHRPDH